MKIGVSGHQHIPAAALRYVHSEIANLIQVFTSDLVGISSLASGADQLFASDVLAAGGELHVVVPSSKYEESFATVQDANTFFELLGRASIVETLDHPIPSQAAFLHAGRRVVDLSDLLVAVWDGKPPRGRGGTGDIVQYARDVGKPFKTIWPAGAKR